MKSTRKRKKAQPTKEPLQREPEGFVPESAMDRYLVLGDDSMVSLDEDGNTHPGWLWNDAVARLEELQAKRRPASKHEGVNAISGKLDVIPMKAMWRRVSNNPRELTLRSKPLDASEAREDFSSEIQKLGEAFVVAWANKDAAFFKDLERMARLTFGTDRQRKKTLEEVIIETALFELHGNIGEVSRDGVMREVERQGFKIDPSDWSATLKRCKLGFLQSIKGRGRPKKPEPKKWVKVECPQGVFKRHYVTESEAVRLCAAARMEMEARAEAERLGEEYIPF